MKQVTKYIANDGTQFDDFASAMERDSLITQVAEIMAPLPERPEGDGCSFSNGGGYLQHDKETALQVRKQLLKLIATQVNHKWIQQTIDNVDTDPSFVGRLVGETGFKALWQAWARFECMDKDWREYGQLYYVRNPHEAEQKQLNPA